MAKTDLNLLVIFDAIMQERSITAAADLLAMTQPSVSNAVSRMRHHWQDPLFIRQGRGITPTPFAEQLWQQIAQPLNTISQAINPEVFEPSSTQQTFRIALTDGMSEFIWPALRHHIELHAPKVKVHAVPYKVDAVSLLTNAEVDLVMDFVPGQSRGIKTEFLFNNHFVAVMAKEHPLAQCSLSLDHYVAADHLLVSLSGDASGTVDSILAEQNLHRHIAMTVNSFAGAVNLINQSNLITTLPYPVVAHAHQQGLVVVKSLPIAVPPAPISLAWHQRTQRSAAHIWLRQTLRNLVDASVRV